MHSSAAPRGERWNFTAFAGCRFGTAEELKDYFQQREMVLTDPVVAALLHSSSGWKSVIDSLIEYASTHTLNLGTLADGDRAAAVMAQALHISESIHDDPAIELASLLAQLGSVSTLTIAASLSVVAEAYDARPQAPISTRLALELLTECGFLTAHTPSSDADESSLQRWYVPSLVRAYVLGRYTVVPEDSSRRTLLDAFSAALMRRVLDSDAPVPAIIDEALRQFDIAHRDGELAALWAEFGPNLFRTNFRQTAAAYSGPRSEAFSTSWRLREARYFTALMRSLLEDGLSLPAAMSRLPLSVPHNATGLADLASKVSGGDCSSVSADDVITSAISAMHGELLEGNPLGAIRIAESGEGAAKRVGGEPMSNFNEARLHLVRGIAQSATSDLRGAEQSLRQALRIAGRPGTRADALLPRIEGRLALSLAAAGDGPSADVHIRSLESMVDCTRPADGVRASLSLAKAIRALDRLDFDEAQRFAEQTTQATTEFEITLVLMKLRSRLSVHTGNAVAEKVALERFLYANEVRRAQFPRPMDELEAEVVNLHLFLGRTHSARALVLRKRMSDDLQSLSRARISLAFGDYDSGYSETLRLLSEPALPLRIKASAAALCASAALDLDLTDSASIHFLETLAYCRYIGSVLPLAEMPTATRRSLVDDHIDHPQWLELLREISDSREEGIALTSRLRDAADPIHAAGGVALSDADSRMLEFLSKGSSVATIAKAMAMAPGTIKNKLSQLYKKIGVNNRREAVQYAHRHSILDD